MTTYNKTIAFVDNAYQGKQKPHFERTVYWLEKFLPECTEAHRVAAYSHDIERAFRDEDTKVPKDYLDKDFLRYHQERGGEIMKEFLLEEGLDQDFIDKVVHLIYRHEEGGDVEQNAIMDADSVSFFETNAEMFVNKKAPVEGYEKVKSKLDWMFERIVSQRAENEAKENYERLIGELEKYKPLTEFGGEAVTFVETSQVKDGVVCDVYSFIDDNSKDLGIIRVSKGYQTPLQRVLKGDKTLETFLADQGILSVTDTDGVETRYNFPSDTSTEVEIKVGDTVQWEATGDLEFAEFCYPPYEDGRFKNLN